MSNAAVHDVITPLEPLASVSLSEQVYGRLRTALMRAELKPDQRLKIRDLAAKLGTSETPVREAIFQLAREGALEIKPRYFVRVRRLSLSQYLENRDIRLQLEPLAAERALPHIRPEDIDQLARLHAKLIAAEQSRDYPTALEANFDFHFGLYWRSAMPTLIELLESLWIRVGPLLNELYPHGHPTYDGPHQHEVVLDALRRRDGYMLREAIRQDLLEGGRNFLRHLEAKEGR
ncbi:GntR family transcriptional regulator [Thalassobaculum sp.]|uniref:GntR family transcriptional regulator n=1 Tax=Thalassobaculum sp. TaxID=2022740 RepID=UPI0032EAEC6A